MLIHNVRDGRRGYIGSWTAEPLDYEKLCTADVGRTVIYQDYNRAEAGTLTSWRDGIVFARYSRGDTAAGANADALVFGVRALDTSSGASSREGQGLCRRSSPRRCHREDRLMEISSLEVEIVKAKIERLETALRIGLELSESGGHGSGASCPTCHFVREARKALGIRAPEIKQPQAN